MPRRSGICDVPPSTTSVGVTAVVAAVRSSPTRPSGFAVFTITGGTGLMVGGMPSCRSVASAMRLNTGAATCPP
jgi:hypothetical protein